MLKTSKGTVPVTLSEATPFERGTGEATRKDIRQGDHVTVFGTTLASGEIVAREIVEEIFGTQPISLGQCVAWIILGTLPLLVLELLKIVRRGGGQAMRRDATFVEKAP